MEEIMVDFQPEANARIQHVKKHAVFDENDKEALALIEAKRGNPAACAGSLADHAAASALSSWFDRRSLHDFKAWYFNSACLLKINYLLKPSISGPLLKWAELLAPLLSDDEGVVTWFCNNDENVSEKDSDNIKTLDYLFYQTKLAIRGEFWLLKERSEAFLANHPSALKKFIPDFRYFLALANGNSSMMEEILMEFTSSKLLKQRNAMEGGFTRDLVSTPATMYAKIAWRHGFCVNLESSYVPCAWLPVKPLNEYKTAYGFMDKLNADNSEDFKKLWRDF
ncbi:hypothetical protein GCM10007874_07920 [Labrys miyagiensis]|uniref:Uncharacterized protein n=1 Tax=Labrys miyagiensis TaxID=346912 RepID=A0ABQ6CBL7_9HYPH|nr:Imm49 family immunity protein [Labrys miyagiensis]GLS17777.1 hypothetical protein GCM10007874_07920 [Labrys miyagiensis]